jgi:hypothetical protein
MLEWLSAELEVYDRFAKRSKDEHLLHKVNLGFDHFNIILVCLLTIRQTLVAIYGNILAFCRHARNAFLGLDNATSEFRP